MEGEEDVGAPQALGQDPHDVKGELRTVLDQEQETAGVAMGGVGQLLREEETNPAGQAANPKLSRSRDGGASLAGEGAIRRSRGRRVTLVGCPGDKGLLHGCACPARKTP